MRISILKWITDWLSREHQFCKSENRPEKQTIVSQDGSNVVNACINGSDSIDRKNKLIRLVIEVLTDMYKGQNGHFEDKVLTLWILDNLFFDMVNTPEFKEQLSAFLLDELDGVFASINIKSEVLPEGQCFSEIAPHVYLQVEKKKISTKKAVISAIPDNGSLLQSEYVLETSIMPVSSGCNYNIGAGKQHLVEGYGFRENHIIIDDDVNSPQYDKNRYVSRAHARITYSNDEGFLLYVERGGTRMAGKRTRIIRGNDKIDVDNVILPEPLHDGDIIELGKSVLLLFKELSN